MTTTDEQRQALRDEAAAAFCATAHGLTPAQLGDSAYIAWLEGQVVTLRAAAAGDGDLGDQGVDDDDTAPHPGDKR